MKRTSKVFLVLVLLFLSISFCVCQSIAANLIMATGGHNGTYYRFGLDIAKLADENGLTIKVVESKGSLDNFQLLKGRHADIAIMQSDAMGWVKAENPEVINQLRVICQLYNEEVHILANKKIKTVKDLHRKRFATGSFGSGTYVSTAAILSANFVGDVEKIFDIKSEDAVMKLLYDEIDAMALVAGKPTPLFKKMEKMTLDPKMDKLLKRIHFLPVTGSKITEKYYVKSSIDPADYAWIPESVPTVAVKAVLVNYKSNPSDQDENSLGHEMKISKLYQIVKSNIEQLKKNGHPKWKEVDLNAPPLGGWKIDPCVKFEVNPKKVKSIFE